MAASPRVRHIRLVTPHDNLYRSTSRYNGRYWAAKRKAQRDERLAHLMFTLLLVVGTLMYIALGSTT